MTWLAPLLDWLAAHPHWAGLAVGLVAFAESLAVVGLVVPGAFIMFAVGALIGTGTLDFWVVAGWAVAGAVAGDGLSFWIGRRHGTRLRTLWPLSRHPEALDRGVRFFQAHGGKSVLIGRFVGPVRPIIPAVAGMMHMPAGRFAVVNLLSALAWAPAYLLPGMVFAASLAVAASVATRLVTVLVAVIVIGWVAWRLARYVNRRVGRVATRLGRLVDAPALRPLRIGVMALRQRAGRAWWVALGLLVASTLLAARGGRPAHWELVVLDALARARSETVRAGAWVVTQLGGTATVAFAAAAVLALLLWYGRRAAAGMFAAVVGGTLAAGHALKYLVAVPRPADLGAGPFVPAFPSSHAVGITVLAFAVARLLAPPGSRYRTALFVVAAALCGAVSLTRLVLGVHWPLDVIGGVALGGVGAGLMGLYRPRRGVGRPLRPVLLTAVCALAVGAVVQGTVDRARGLSRYPPATVWPTLAADAGCDAAAEQWRLSAGARLWRGTRAALGELAGTGWRTAPSWTLQGSLQWLHPGPDPAALPPLPALRHGRLAEAVWLRPVGREARLVLRAWPVGDIADSPARWWRLEVRQEQLHPLWPITVFDATPAEMPVMLGDLGRLCA